MSGLLQAATVAAAVGAAVSGGTLFAFSSFVMPALGRVPDAVGLRAMQAINRAAPTPSFMVVLLGTGLVTTGVAIVGTAGGQSEVRLVIPAAVLYAATLAITIGYHVPRNDALATLDAAAAASAPLWRTYLRTWSRWNHVRTATAVGAAVLLVLDAR